MSRAVAELPRRCCFLPEIAETIEIYRNITASLFAPHSAAM
jgi:hypothetical protein